MKILAVDDDEIALKLLTGSLSASGYNKVQLCTSASDALSIVAREKVPFDCFLLDIQMPGMNGIELCRKLRADKRYWRTPIIMVTAKSEKTFIDGAFAAGATDYITKPFDPLEVSVRLNLAAELGSERKYLSESVDVIDSLLRELKRTNRHDLEEAIDIGKSDRILSYPAFENYLFRLSRGVFFLTSIFAVKLENIEQIHENLSSQEFKDLLTRSAGMIVEILRRHEVFLAYRGNGVFIGTMQRSGGQTLKKLGGKIRVKICNCDDEIKPGLPRTTGLVFGDPVITKIFTKPGSLKYLCTAIDNAQNSIDKKKIKQLQSVIVPHLKASQYQRENAEQLNQLRSEYERMLRDELDNDLPVMRMGGHEAAR